MGQLRNVMQLALDWSWWTWAWN